MEDRFGSRSTSSGSMTFMGAMRRNLWVFLVVTVLVLIAGTVVVLTLPDSWRVRGAVAVRLPLSFEDMRDTAPRLEEESQRLLVQLTAKPLLIEVAGRTGLLDRESEKMGQEGLAEVFRSKLTIVPEGTRAYVVNLDGSEPQKMTYALNLLLERVVESSREKGDSDREATSAALRNKLDGVLVELEDLNSKIAGFKKLYAGSLPEDLEANLVLMAQANERMLLGRMSEPRGRDDTRALETVEAGALGRYADVVSKYKQEHPDVWRAGEVLKSIKRYRQAAGLAEEAVPELEIAKDAMERISQLEKRLGQVPEVGERLGVMMEQRRILLERKMSLQRQLDDATMRMELFGDGKGAPYQIVEMAHLPKLPSGPNRLLLLGLVLLGAVVAGFLTVIVRDLFTQALSRRRTGNPM